ncbi:Putative glycosyltransferase EpsE [Thiorhodovibrio winogradskyi]|uniref:Glycosyltransferase EpsE n=1 Tax=Thiorhodovibrio winogradskyi TaxID=77007 RepID=A0ABZ0SF48_9GAMM|nr:glycosyltransferase [Thiorhodovibrio winogradskyi]
MASAGIADQDLVSHSSFFDPSWYLEHHPHLRGELHSPADALDHFMAKGGRLGYSPGPRFDSSWYLSEYPDVARAAINPLVHYLRHGQHEGRQPRRNPAILLEHLLWRGLAPVMVPRLWKVARAADEDALVRQHAAWALARWMALQADWQTVERLLLEFGGERIAVHGFHGPLLLAIDAACRLRHQSKALALLTKLRRFATDHSDAALAQANVAAASATSDLDAEKPVLACFNALWAKYNLSPIQKRDLSRTLSLDNLAGTDSLLPAIEKTDSHPLVSVILPVFNAEKTIATAVFGLYQQTWPRLEIIIVDDASTDTTLRQIQRLCQYAPPHQEITVLRHARNQGAYSARNTGLERARGNLITTHDADDWSHPQKIARQVAALEEAPGVVACVSSWVRTTATLHVSNWWVAEHWSEISLSSLMIRRDALSELGYWDEVKVGADSELYERIRVRYGSDAIIEVLPGVPLAFARLQDKSLTQSPGPTHLATQYVGARKDYQDLYRRWHERARRDTRFYMPRHPDSRLFPAPLALLTEQMRVQCSDPLDRIQVSGWFDPIWYLHTHIDLQSRIIDPLEHYWTQGLAEARDPGPHFSTSGYLVAYPEVHQSGRHPLLHFLQQGRQSGHQPWPILPGRRSKREDWPTLLFCAHQANLRLFGAELALLDLLELLAEHKVNLLVSLPSAANRGLLSRLLSCCVAVAVFPYGWWQSGRPTSLPTVRHFRALIEHFRVDRVHVNTSVLEEPLIAAREAGVPVWLHLHELPDKDEELCATLAATPSQIASHILERSDRVLANSNTTAAWLRGQANHQFDHAPSEQPTRAQVPIEVFLNPVDLDPLFALPPPPQLADHCRIGMISSNLPKKGLTDFERLAKRLRLLDPSVECHLIGPQTDALASVLQRQSWRTGEPAIKTQGYTEDLAKAFKPLDILVNLSQFQESFGRTILEAMAAARAVVAYDWGALPDLVEHGVTGYLTTYRDVDAVAHYVVALAGQRRRLISMGLAGRARAMSGYGRTAQQQALQGLLRV